MNFLYENSTLLLGIVIFMLCFLIGYFGDKRMKSKSKTQNKEKIIISKNEQSPNYFGLPDDESVNNIFWIPI